MKAPKGTGTLAGPPGPRQARILGVGGFRPSRVVPNSEIVEDRISASEIGTSMLTRPCFSPPQAEAKKGWPTKTTVGSAMAAEIQWNMSRVAASAPDQTAIDKSMMFIIAKPATPIRIKRSRPRLSVSVAESMPGSSS